MIKVLEDQLNAEKQRREELTSKFKEQLSEFESERDSLEKLRKASNLMEKRQLDRQSTIHTQPNITDLDLIPTRET